MDDGQKLEMGRCGFLGLVSSGGGGDPRYTGRRRLRRLDDRGTERESRCRCLSEPLTDGSRSELEALLRDPLRIKVWTFHGYIRPAEPD